MSADLEEGFDLREFLTRCEGQIREQGCVIIWTPMDRRERTPPFAYTVGLTERFKRPELLVFGFTHDDALVLLNTIVRRYLRTGFGVPLDQPIAWVLDQVPVIIKSVATERARPYARIAIERCRHLKVPCQVQQVVVPDPHGQFPWESGYDKRFERIQPRLFELQ